MEAVEVAASSGVEAIDRARVDAVQTWRKKPRMIDGEPVRACTSTNMEIRAGRA